MASLKQQLKYLLVLSHITHHKIQVVMSILTTQKKKKKSISTIERKQNNSDSQLPVLL